eukprot:6887975-Prymnesium_polylepis.1
MAIKRRSNGDQTAIKRQSNGNQVAGRRGAGLRGTRARVCGVRARGAHVAAAARGAHVAAGRAFAARMCFCGAHVLLRRARPRHSTPSGSERSAACSVSTRCERDEPAFISVACVWRRAAPSCSRAREHIAAQENLS